MTFQPPSQPANSIRIVLTLTSPQKRLDQVLLEALRNQARNIELKNISRANFKELFKKRRIRIKDQIATPSSALASGTTYVDIIGFEEELPPHK